MHFIKIDKLIFGITRILWIQNIGVHETRFYSASFVTMNLYEKNILVNDVIDKNS